LVVLEKTKCVIGKVVIHDFFTFFEVTSDAHCSPCLGG
jgi:NADH:ubiquinone oxidoreductase subunit F (NADH-binding)